MKNNRLIYLDAVKGVAILCIVLLHFEDGVFPHTFNVWIGLFMITAFYFSCGFLRGLRDEIASPGVLWRKRLRQLGIPYLAFGILILFFDGFLYWCGQMPLKLILRDGYKFLVLRGIGTLWFLPVLLFGETLFVFVCSRRRPWLWGTAVLALTLAACRVYYHHWLPLREIDDWHRIIDAPMRPIVQSLQAFPVIAAGFGSGKIWKKYHERFVPGLIFFSG
ncbi:MAG: acyltransferase family protein, partial [Clostridia bacterium]|nr:acyltransferase family protein [Clostridia bacterium]